MEQALYRKYRSRSLAEIVGQEHVTETLRRAIETGKVSHAYLFTGPRGVGKTSIARILAHELNAVPYNGEDAHLDIIEIDAASNGGVEEVRNLRDKVHIAPSSGSYKVYIIDEVHMMTGAAFNALLKTLEEPPAHAVFILATTEAHKVPATIVSRTQRYTFRPIVPEKIVAHLRFIAGQENIAVTDEALALMAEHSEGSFRDAIGMLDQAANYGSEITEDTVRQLLGIPPADRLDAIVEALIANNVTAVAAELTAARLQGHQAGTIAKQLAQRLRNDLVHRRASLEPHASLTLLSRLIDVPTSTHPEQLLEIVLFEAIVPRNFLPLADAAPTAPAAMPLKSSTPAPAASAPLAATAQPPTRPAPPSVHEEVEDDTPPTAHQLDPTSWQPVLDRLKKDNNTLYGIVRMARTAFEPGKVTLTFGFAFHQKRANDAKNKKIITAAIEALTGYKLALTCAFDPTVSPSAPVPSGPAVTPSADITAVSAIFGGAEIVQS